MLLAKIATDSSNGLEIGCLLLLIGWLLAAALALISLIKPIVSTLNAVIVAVLLFIVWIVLC